MPDGANVNGSNKPDCKWLIYNDFKENRGGVGIMDQIT